MKYAEKNHFVWVNRITEPNSNNGSSNYCNYVQNKIGFLLIKLFFKISNHKLLDSFEIMQFFNKMRQGLNSVLQAYVELLLENVNRFVTGIAFNDLKMAINRFKKSQFCVCGL